MAKCNLKQQFSCLLTQKSPKSDLGIAAEDKKKDNLQSWSVVVDTDFSCYLACNHCRLVWYQYMPWILRMIGFKLLYCIWKMHLFRQHNAMKCQSLSSCANSMLLHIILFCFNHSTLSSLTYLKSSNVSSPKHTNYILVGSFVLLDRDILKSEVLFYYLEHACPAQDVTKVLIHLIIFPMVARTAVLVH